MSGWQENPGYMPVDPYTLVDAVYKGGKAYMGIWALKVKWTGLTQTAVEKWRLTMTDEQHPDDAAVDRFAAQMKLKLSDARAKGKGGWDDPEKCSVDFLAEQMSEHLLKGNPGNWLDIANLAMMLHERGAPTSALGNAIERRGLLFIDRQEGDQ